MSFPERSVLYIYVRIAIYSAAALVPIFSLGQVSYPFRIYLPSILVFGVTLIGCTAYLLQERRKSTTWTWGWDVNPLWLPIWRVSCLELLCSSSIIYALSSLLFQGLNLRSEISLAWGVGGMAGIILSRLAHFHIFAPLQCKQIVFENQGSRFYLKGAMVMMGSLIVFGLIILSLSRSGPRDFTLFSRVHDYLEIKYGENPSLLLSNIKYNAIDKDGGLYLVHFTYGEHVGYLQIRLTHPNEKDEKWDIQSSQSREGK